MGTALFDQYSLLHFSSGIIAKFFRLSFVNWFILNIVFEYFENISEITIFINKLKWWPGGKPKSDTFINSVGDIFSAMLGWHVADILKI
jgi:hypothetical protein